jgi:hypothetical protein
LEVRQFIKYLYANSFDISVNNTEVTICQNKNDLQNNASPIVISDVVSQFNEERMNELAISLNDIDVSHTMDINIYRIISGHIWNGDHLHSHSPQNMEVLILLYKYLSDEVADETEQIRCIGVSGRYLSVVRDFANNNNIQLTVTDKKPESTEGWSIVLSAFGWLLISIMDVLLSFFMKPFFSLKSGDLLVKFPIFRPSTFRPIEKNINMEYDSIFTLLTISYFTNVDLATDDCRSNIPIRCCSSIYNTLYSYEILIYVVYDLLFAKSFETSVVDAVEAESGIRLEETIGELTRRAAWSNIDVYLYYSETCGIFEKNNYKATLLTTFSPSGKAMGAAAAEYNIDVYNLPHGVSSQPIGIKNSFCTGVFCEGEIVKVACRGDASKYTPTGLPKLVSVYNRRSSIPDSTDSKNLLIATTYIQQYRQEFIRDVVPAILKKTDWNLVINIHPMENISFYENIISEIGVDVGENNRVEITDDDLHPSIGRANLVLTTISNAGIESVLLGTPAASYNPWSPDLRDPLWAKHGEVPCLRTPSEVISYISEVDCNAECERQESMLDNLYHVRDNSNVEIAKRIQAEIVKQSDNHN